MQQACYPDIAVPEKTQDEVTTIDSLFLIRTD
jgi:hypothetical protein